MIKIVVPMAGYGKRFAERGYAQPKPLIPVLGRPMIARVIDNLRMTQPHEFIFLALRASLDENGLRRCLLDAAPTCRIVEVDGVTAGAACTVLLAKRAIDCDDPLVIANCDQLVDIDMDDFAADLQRRELDGLIMTMTASDTKWSFARCGQDNLVEEVAEKRVISHEATTGIYMFRTGRDFVDAAEEMIAKEIRVNGEFYVAPVYNELISRGARIGIYNVGTLGAGMYGLGTPDDLEAFVRGPQATRLLQNKH